MKKSVYLLASIFLICLCVVLASCNTVIPDNAGIPYDEGKPVAAEGKTADAESVSEVSANISAVNDTSISDEKYVWYTEEQLAEWYSKYINTGSLDNVHGMNYHEIDSILYDYIGQDLFMSKINEMFAGTEDVNIAAVCEYFDISKEEYMSLYEPTYDSRIVAKKGEKPAITLYFYCFEYDAWFDGDYWDNELFLIDGYKAPEYDTFHGEVPEGDNHTRRYYTVDWRLIEYVGTEKFEAWLADNPEASDRNIIKFISDFGITREQYDKIYAVPLLNGTGRILLPYNPDYLFGTEEMIKEYFTVHPLG